MTDADYDDFRRNLAFNKGCQARLDGRHHNCNPYHHADESNERRSFLEGWNHVHMYFGTWRPSWMRESPRPLPPIQGKVA